MGPGGNESIGAQCAAAMENNISIADAASARDGLAHLHDGVIRCRNKDEVRLPGHMGSICGMSDASEKMGCPLGRLTSAIGYPADDISAAGQGDT